jgi:hypothetical protein
MVEQHNLDVIALFTSFLEAFGKATPEERRSFLDFISPQSRADLLNLADALRQKAERDDPSRKA